MARRFDAVVVGCGIAGASTAFFLQRKGLNVLALERERPAAGGTGMSAAILRQHYSTPLMARLAHAAIGIFRDAHALLGHDAGYRRVGYVFLVPPESLAAARSNVAMQRALGIETAMLEPRELAERMTWLNLDGVAGAAFEPDGGYADPETATAAFVAAFRERGGELRERTAARALLREGDRVVGVQLDDDEVRADWVVNAAGPWAAPLAMSAGLELRMRTVREQDTVWEGLGGRPLPGHSISNAVDAIYLRPLGDRRYIVGRGFPKEYVDVDPYNYKKTADDAFIADVQERMTRRIPPLAGAKLVNAYAALYDVTADWYQYVGPRAGIAGYADFCGGSGHGFKEAPAIARELADWLVEGRVREDFRQFSHDRVAAGNLFVQSYGGNRG
jgi:glycine/D-amino acid oxidase-like deaminating enzyme